MLAVETKAAELTIAAVRQSAEFNCFWKQVIEPIEPFLDQVSEQLSQQVEDFEAEIVGLARYVLINQGKQLRPVLVGLSAEASGQIHTAHVTAAVIVEMVHLATLVHDDVMDEAEVRRRQPTAAAHWGNELSVLLGDCLFAHALKLAASYPTPDVCRAVSAATNTACSGEILQTLRRRNMQLSRTEYFRILEMKTGELFALSCELGAFLSGAVEEEKTALRQFGLLFGTAYQMYDDCLDLFGAEASAGKSLGMDLAHGKLTLPVLIFLERACSEDQGRFVGWLGKWKPLYLSRVVELVQRYEVLHASRVLIHQRLAAARRNLDSLPPSESRTALTMMTEFLEQQTSALGVSSRCHSRP
jgi:octaprenyl-diphosphate synthase